MANLMSVRTLTSTPQYQVSENTNENKREKHAVVCLFSRGNFPSAIRYVTNLAKQSAMPYRLLGDLTKIQDPSKSLSTDSLMPMTRNEGDDFVHNIYLFHGEILNGNHIVNVRHGNANDVNTSNLLRAMHWPSSMSSCQAGVEKKSKNIDYHLSCKSGALRNEFSATEAFWKSNISLIFSSKKVTAIDHIGTALESALRYASYCNNPVNQASLDQFKLFLYAGLRRGDCLTMLGGELKAPLIWHAPKNHDDLLFQNMSSKVHGHPLDCGRLKQAILSLTFAQLNRLPPEREQWRDMFFTRITRNDVESVAQILTVDGSLMNEQSLLGSSALNWSILVGAQQCTNYLLSAGADINSVDGYGVTALSRALEKDKPELVRYLLTKGANPDACDAYVKSPLMIAASKGWLQQVKTLLQFHAKIDVWKNGHSALTIAVEQGDYDIVDALIIAGADAGSGLDQTLIAKAEARGDIAIFDLLERSLAADNENNYSDFIKIDQPESKNSNG